MPTRSLIHGCIQKSTHVLKIFWCLKAETKTRRLAQERNIAHERYTNTFLFCLLALLKSTQWRPLCLPFLWSVYATDKMRATRKIYFCLEGISCVCRRLCVIWEACCGLWAGVLCAPAGPLTLHSTPALPLNFPSIKVQFVHKLAVNDPSFVHWVRLSVAAAFFCLLCL